MNCGVYARMHQLTVHAKTRPVASVYKGQSKQTYTKRWTDRVFVTVSAVLRVPSWQYHLLKCLWGPDLTSCFVPFFRHVANRKGVYIVWLMRLCHANLASCVDWCLIVAVFPIQFVSRCICDISPVHVDGLFTGRLLVTPFRILNIRCNGAYTFCYFCSLIN